MTAPPFDVRIDGLKEFNREIKKAGPEMARLVKEANFDAAEKIAKVARAKGEAQGGVARKASAKLKATKTQGYAAIRGGGKGQGYFFGAEFGAYRYKRFKPWRGNSRTETWEGGPGYFLAPAIREEGRTVINDYNKKLEEIFKRAFDK